MDGLHIDVVDDAVDRVHVVVDEHHILVFQGKTAGNMESNLSRPDDNDLR